VNFNASVLPRTRPLALGTTGCSTPPNKPPGFPHCLKLPGPAAPGPPVDGRPRWLAGGGLAPAACNTLPAKPACCSSSLVRLAADEPGRTPMLAAPAAEDGLEPPPVCCRDVLRAEPGLLLGLLVPLDMSALWL
jgi:hypothetical protein